MFRLFISLTFIHIVSGQSCLLADTLGPYDASLGGCAPDADLVVGTDETGQPACCHRNKLITTVAPTTVAAGVTDAATSDGATTGATTAAATAAPGGSSAVPGSATTSSFSFANCVDKVNPRTGVSDCSATANLCNDPNYSDVMTRQCPRTCNRCSSASTGVATGTGNCVDLPNPRTGVSDCPSLARLCNDPNYITLMTTQCPRTCGRCNSSSGTTGSGTATTSASTGTCQDRVNPSTGRSDCSARRNLCNNSAYVTLMREQCPVTCGFC